MAERKSFASDNNAGVHPRIMDALVRANQGSSPAYGSDPWTEEARALMKGAFGQDADAYFVLLGTAANVLGLKTMLRPYNSMMCSELAHINVDECGAPEAITGSKIITLPHKDGKIDPADCLPVLEQRETVHSSYPLVLSITQSTECGTVYSLEELLRIKAFCREHRLYLHMDGARLSNAAAYLGCSLKELTVEAGVDVLSFGGTKNGLMLGEAVVFFNKELGEFFPHIRKQYMQLSSKMRFIAAQFIEYLKDGLWLENAKAANEKASLLAAELGGLEHVRIVHPVQANQVFARMPQELVEKLSKDFYFYVFDPSDGDGCPKGWPKVRLMTSFNTTREDVMILAKAVRQVE